MVPDTSLISKQLKFFLEDFNLLSDASKFAAIAIAVAALSGLLM